MLVFPHAAEWMVRMRFNLGDRVRISTTYHWARGASGTITLPPDAVVALVQDRGPWQGLTRDVKGVQGTLRFHWVTFDEPQRDADGDGPYRGGEIDVEAIERLGDPRAFP